MRLFWIIAFPFVLPFSHHDLRHRLHEGIGFDVPLTALPLEMEIVEESQNLDMTLVVVAEASQAHCGIAPRYHDDVRSHLYF